MDATTQKSLVAAAAEPLDAEEFSLVQQLRLFSALRGARSMRASFDRNRLRPRAKAGKAAWRSLESEDGHDRTCELRAYSYLSSRNLHRGKASTFRKLSKAERILRRGA